MSSSSPGMLYAGRRCCECKHFHMANCDPKTQRCKKYNKPVKIFDEADDCKGFKIKEWRR